jgi:hypothetical protein
MPRHATKTSFRKGREAWNKRWDSRKEWGVEYYRKNRKHIILKSRRWHIERNFGISVEEYDRRKKLQGRRCGLCGEPMRGRKPAVLDHDPKTGQIREFVHRGCNILIGLARENPTFLRKIERYINKHRARI